MILPLFVLILQRATYKEVFNLTVTRTTDSVACNLRFEMDRLESSMAGHKITIEEKLIDRSETHSVSLIQLLNNNHQHFRGKVEE